MDYLVNELSLNGQFHDFEEFHRAVRRLMEIRREILRVGSSIYCHRGFAHAMVTSSAVMQQAIQTLPNAERRAWMQWITRLGPYWTDVRIHNDDEWLEANDDIVTNSAVGEAALCCLRGLPRELVSLAPSDWLYSPIVVKWRNGTTLMAEVPVVNHWDISTIRKSLDENPVLLESWEALGVFSIHAFTRLTFANDAFDPLGGHAFSPGAAIRIRVLLNTLDALKACFDEDGRRTAEGHRLHAEHFTGKKAWFSDSSDTEKEEFRNELTFAHPESPGKSLFASWHGKVKSPQIRIHFSWPVTMDTPLYILYVGPKITKR